MPRKEGRAKVTGQARYIDDVILPAMLHGATVRSPVPRGHIRGVRFADGIPWHEFTIVTARDVPAPNRVVLILDDQPCLADGNVNHAEEPVVLLAHADKAVLEQARRAVTIDIDPLPAVFSIDDALAARTVVWGDDNIFKSVLVSRGDVDEACRGAHLIVEGEYETGAQEQLYIEPQGMMADCTPDGASRSGARCSARTTCTKRWSRCSDCPADKVRVVQMETGGGFGGKEEYPSIIAAPRGAARVEVGPAGQAHLRPRRRHGGDDEAPSVADAASDGGRRATASSSAMDIDFVIDGGAYCTLSPVVLSRGTIHAAGPYFCPNVRVRGRAVATNAPPHGAFRGFGAPQSLFALERHMDRVAQAVGLSPDDFRRRNFIRTGQTSAVGQVMRDPVDMGAASRSRAGPLRLPRQARRFAETNPHAGSRKGIGFATFMHGAGFTGSGEDHLASIVDVEATAEGRVRVLAASTEIGQGTNTIFAQIAADAARRGRSTTIEIAQPDTVACARQRADRRVAHVHGRRQARRVGRARGERPAARHGPAPGTVYRRGIQGGVS